MASRVSFSFHLQFRFIFNSAGQTFIIGLGFICYNLIELYNGKLSEGLISSRISCFLNALILEHLACHYRSLSLIVPFVGCVFGLVRKVDFAYFLSET